MTRPRRLKIVALPSPSNVRLRWRAGGIAGNHRGWGGDSDPLTNTKWPSGWWILPFAIGGLIETIALFLWLTGHL